MTRIKWIVLVTGSVSVIAQTLVLREGLALFGGNELVAGMLLCIWLVWVGIGSVTFSTLKPKHNPLPIYAALLFILGFLALFSVTVLRIAPKVFSLPFGEVIPLDKMLYIALIALTPACFTFGALFPLASRMLEPEKVYLMEGIGSFLGGILLSFLLIEILPPYGILLIVLFALISAALVIAKKMKLLFVPFVVLLFLIRVDDIEMFFRKQQMGGQNLAGLGESKYGVIGITKAGTQMNFYTNGVYDFTYPDEYSSENAVHYALLLHTAPKNVLLIGGGLGNCLVEIRKHPSIDSITYLELDPLLFKMGEEFIGSDLHAIRNLNVIFGDARFFVKNATNLYDVIIVNLPDPVNAQLNRFYTQEFFAEAKRILQDNGILSVRIAAPPDIVSPLFGQLLNTVYRTLNLSFVNILILPAAKTTFIATDEAIGLDNIVELLKSRIRQRKLVLTYVNEYFFTQDLSAEKLNYLEDRVKESKGFVNRDLKPVCYYFTTILWGGVVAENLKGIFVRLFGISPLLYFLPLILIFLFYRKKTIVYISVLAVGASNISAEIIIIVLFQVFYGYVYGWIGAIIGCYMIGVALGVFYYTKVGLRKGNLVVGLSNLQMLMSLFILAIILLSLLKLPITNILIPLMVLIGGFLGGMHFPMSVNILSRDKAGLVYGIDLIGASLGALVTSVIFIPILGIPYTLSIFVLLNLITGIGLRTIK